MDCHMKGTNMNIIVACAAALIGAAIGYAVSSHNFQKARALELAQAAECPRPFQLMLEINGFSEAQVEEALREAYKTLNLYKFPDIGAGYGIAPGEVVVPSTWWKATVKCRDAKTKPSAAAAQVYQMIAPKLAHKGMRVDPITGVISKPLGKP